MEGVGDVELELEGDVELELEGDVELELELEGEAGGKKLLFGSLPTWATRYITAAESTIILSIPTKAAIYSINLFYKCLRPL